MEIVNKSIKDVKPYEKNPRKNKKAVDYVAESIKQFGFKVPIVIDKDNVIVCGHTRLLAAKKLKLDEVPCVIADDLTDEQIKAFRLADNKVSEFAEWDFDLLSGELDGILDIDMSDFGFDLSLNEEPSEVEEDEVPEEVETRCKLGDLWELGGHRLICGDSTDVTVIDRLMDGVKADMVFTDPPYNLQTEGGCKGSIGKSLKKQGKDIEFIADFNPTDFLNVLPIVFNGNMNAYIFCNKELLPDYLNWCKDSGYSWNVLIWKKPTAIPIGDSHRPDIEYLLLFRKNALWNNGTDANYSRCLQYDRVKKSEENGNHPTPKPIELIANELKISSNKNSVVVDFFGGSGSTLIACEQLNRKCYMCELDPHYVDVIIERWENLTGQKAELVEKP
jgi:site-specific DNA-methyltransferase (adenine-specific)